MDIKDSYLHGTVGVVKSISVSADKLQYKLADIAGTVKEVTLPVATTSANGLMSSGDKTKLDNLSSTIGNYVTLNTDQEITGIKTFTKQLKFTVAKGTAPFLVTSDTKVDNLNADLLDGKSSSDFLQAALVTSSTSLNNDEAWINQYARDYPRSYVYNNNGIEWQYLIGLNSSQSNYGSVLRTSYKDGGTIQLKALVDNSWGAWKTVAFTDSNITGNAATADKLKTKRKLWGLDFDGSADVSGNLTGVKYLFADPSSTLELITPSGSNLYIYFRYNNNDLSSVALTGHGFVPTAASSNKLSLGTTNNKWKAVYATDFIGNLDGTYVNKLTGYTIATTRGAVAATDSLNTALGKLEYKAILGETAYDWYKSVTGTDNDDIINKWEEIVGFIDSVKEGTDILDEFVTRKTLQEITASKTFKNLDGIYFRTGNYGLRLLGNGEYGYLQLGLIQSDGTKVHKGQITGIYNETLSSLNIKSITTVTTGTFTATKLITSGGTSSQFVKGDGSLDSNTYLTSSGTIAYANKLKYNTQIKTLEDLDGFLEANTFKVATFSSITGPYFAGNDGMVLSIPWTSTSYGAQIIIDDNHGGLVKIRQKENTTWSNWYTFLTSKNYTSYLPFLNSSDTHATNTSVIYAPTSGGTLNQVLISNGTSAPTWVNLNTIAAGSASTSAKLSSTTVISAKSFSLSTASWTDTGYTFASLATGTYAIQVTSGSNLVASGIMSIYNNLSDTAGDEIPLHVYSTAGWRPYLRTYANKLLISSNDTSSTSRTVTIKIALIL